jgi:methanesulfonate monooxygenase small subunit
MGAADVSAREAVRDTIYKAALCLDDQKWSEWLSLCDQSFNYAIKSFSPEISYDMTYMEKSWPELESMLGLLPRHNTDHSPLKRHTSVYTVDVAPDGKSARAVSSFVIYQTMLDGEHSHYTAGESRLFLVGRYIDEFKIGSDGARFTKREVRLENRRLDKGSHWPL